MTQSLPIAKHAETELVLLPALANRHGLITGATGTGKTVTPQRLRAGLPPAYDYRRLTPSREALGSCNELRLE